MKICKMGVWDDSIPGINFDSEGVSNYANTVSFNEGIS